MTIGLMLAIFYIGYVLTSSPDNGKSSIAPIKTKAQSIPYNKVIAFNTSSSGNVGSLNDQTSAPSPTLPVNYSLTPTRTLLANQTLTITPSLTISPTNSASVSATPTVIATLPKTGYLSNVIIIFAVAGLMIFFSFLY